jgi:hypothetical protein
MVLLHLNCAGSATHRKPAVKSGYYRVPEVQDSNALSTFQEVRIRA